MASAKRPPRRGNRVVRGDVAGPSFEPARRSGRARVSEMQRVRLLGGAVAAVEKLGWSNVTVASIASRARVSRKTFYDLFVDREDCLLAIMDETSAWVTAELAAADLDELSWRERIRAGLWIVLSFFDREPELARFCVVQSARGSQRMVEWREQNLDRLIAIVDEGRLQSERAAQVPPLTAEGVVGAVIAIVHRRLQETTSESLSELQNELTAIIVLPYLGRARAARELKHQLGGVDFSLRPDTAAKKTSHPRPAYRAGQDPLKDVPMRLTYRTMRVLEAVLARPGSSNRLLGELADIHDQGQISKLLARLERLGLLANGGGGQSKGEPNAWRLTELGGRVIEHLSLGADLEHGAS